MSDYFSDKELGQKDRISEEISLPVWNGIVSIYEEFKTSNSFSSNFSEICSDNNRVCGFNQKLFDDRIKSEIPTVEIPIVRKSEEDLDSFVGFNNQEKMNDKVIDKYMTLDFIQFCYKNIEEALEDDFHSFFTHYHLKFEQSEELKKDYRDKINQIFERNGIVFFINDDGQINRTIPKAIEPLINQIFSTSDTRLNDLVRLAHEKFILPKVEDRIHALEKIWDAFERVKAYYGEKKKVSADELVKLVASGNNDIKEVINTEASTLSKIGNNFQIRHFENGKVEITDNKQIDYLFYRMVSLMHLFLSSLEQE